MKRISLFMAAIALFALCGSLSVSAQEYGQSGQADADVFAVYKYMSDSDEISATEQNGKFTANLPNGDCVTATATDATTGLMLVVYRVSVHETDAFDWLKECTSSVGTASSAYHIYFVDKDGKHVIVTGIPLKLTISDNDRFNALCSVSQNGNETILNANFEQHSITFFTDENEYYVIAQKKAAGNLDSPQTGEDFTDNPLLYLTAFGFSIIMMACFSLAKVKHNTNK